MAIRLVKIVWCQIVFCQENLTENDKSVDNRDTYLSFSNMAGGLNRLAQAGAVALTLGGAAEAQEATNVSFETLDKAVVEEIAANYKACVAEELATIDENNNGLPDPNEDIEFYEEGVEYCQEELARKVAHAERIAAGEVRIAELEADIATQNELQAAAEAGIAAAIERSRRLTEEIIAGAKKEAGL